MSRSIRRMSNIVRVPHSVIRRALLSTSNKSTLLSPSAYSSTSVTNSVSRCYSSTPTLRHSSSSSHSNKTLSMIPDMMSTIDPRPSTQQTAYTLEVPFAILDMRHGVWADIISEVERENIVKVGRLRNHFQKTTLTVHALNDEQFAAASEAIQDAQNRVFEHKVPIPDQDSKLRIIGRNGVRMDSVSRKYGVNIRYNETELMAYIQGRSKQEVSAAAQRLNAFELQVELSHNENYHLRANDSAIDAIERKWNVQISSIPNISWKPPTLPVSPKNPPSLYVVVGGKENVDGAKLDMNGVARRMEVDLAPWLVHKDIVIPANRKEIVIGPDRKRFEHWKKKYNGITFHINNHQVDQQQNKDQPNLNHGDMPLTISGPSDKVDKVVEELNGFIGAEYDMPRERALQLINEKMQKKSIFSTSKNKDISFLEQLEREHDVDIFFTPEWQFSKEEHLTFRISKKKKKSGNNHSTSNSRDNSVKTNEFDEVLKKLQEFHGVEDSISLPRRRVGPVVGKYFKNVIDIQEKFNVALRLKQKNQIVDDGELIMWGAAENIKMAKEKIKELIGVRKSVAIPNEVALKYKDSFDQGELFDLQRKLSVRCNVNLLAITDTEIHLRGGTEENLTKAIEWLNRNVITDKRTIQLKPEDVGRVIGAKAVNLKRIIRDHNVVIKKPQTIDAKLTMNILGYKSNVENAVADVNQLIGFDEICHIPKGYLEEVLGHKFSKVIKLNKLYGVFISRSLEEDTDQTRGFRVWGRKKSNIENAIHAMKKIIKENENMSHSPVDVHRSLWGLLIGGQGVNIRALEALYEIKVQSPTKPDSTRSSSSTTTIENQTVENDHLNGSNTFVVRGESKENVDKAVIKIKNFTRAPWAYNKLGETCVYLEMDIPMSHHGRVVGIGGENITQIRKTHGIDIRLPPMHIDATLCVMKGPSIEVNKKALDMIAEVGKLSFHSESVDLFGNPVYIGTPANYNGKRFAAKRSGPNIDAEILEKINGKRIPLNGNESLTGISKVTGAHLPMLLKICRELNFKIDNPLIPLDSDHVEMIVMELGGEPIMNDSNKKILVRSKRILEEGEGQIRSPIVAIMGHVDHGKTTLLDNLRSGNVAEGEIGGITQATSAFTVSKQINNNNNKSSGDGGKKKNAKKSKRGKKQAATADPSSTVTFVDTPGHAAFSSMRESGINSTDILVLVVAADDGVMNQTIESGTAALDVGIPIVVAITKCDIDGIDADNAQIDIESELTKHGIISENMGGDVPVVRVSGVTGEGTEELIETLSLQSEIMGLKAEYKAPAEAVVLEGSYLKGVGPVADVIVQWGTLKARDFVVVGGTYGRVKSLTTPDGKPVKTAPPSTPVRIMGLNNVPKSGTDLIVVGSLEEAREAAEAFTLRDEWAKMVVQSNESQEEVSAASNDFKNEKNVGEEEGEEEDYLCNLIVVTNSDGSLSAVEACIDVVTNETGVKFPILRSIVGEVSQGDIEEAAASGAMLLTFNSKLPRPIQMAAQSTGLEISNYDLIYQLEDTLRERARALLPAVFEERRGGKAEALQIFHLNGRNAGSVIGLRLKQGTFDRSSKYRLIRGGEVVAEDLKVRSLRILKEDVQEVKSGSDCGLLLEDSEGHGVVGEVGDEVECYTQVEVERV